MNTTTKMELVSIDKLIPYINNARTHSPEQVNKLRSSLREFGFINPVIIDKDYNVIAGHGRILAAREEHIDEVPCVFVDYLTEAQKKAYILADNRMAMDAGWDEELLRIEIEALQAEAFDVSLTGFDDQEIADLFGDEKPEVEDDDFDLSAALEKASFVEEGDVWTVGKHRLMCGDATRAKDVEKLMGDKKANLILTDPPYGVSFQSSDGLSIQNDSIKGEEFYQFLLSAFQNMASHLEKGGAAYIFHADTEGLNFRRAFIDAGFHLAGCCIWVKNSRNPRRLVGIHAVAHQEPEVSRIGTEKQDSGHGDSYLHREQRWQHRQYQGEYICRPCARCRGAEGDEDDAEMEAGHGPQQDMPHHDCRAGGIQTVNYKL